jgi:hypothetical protein
MQFQITIVAQGHQRVYVPYQQSEIMAIYYFVTKYTELHLFSVSQRQWRTTNQPKKVAKRKQLNSLQLRIYAVGFEGGSDDPSHGDDGLIIVRLTNEL